MQIFNQLNARLIEHGEFNIFKGIEKNWLFTFITLLTVVVQIIMVEVGGQVTTCYPLDIWQNMICFFIASGELIWGIVIKFMPLRFFQFYSLDDTAPVEGTTLTGLMKKSSIISNRQKQIRKEVDQNIKVRMLTSMK